jgi:hypothetical protein
MSDGSPSKLTVYAVNDDGSELLQPWKDRPALLRSATPKEVSASGTKDWPFGFRD